MAATDKKQEEFNTPAFGEDSIVDIEDDNEKEEGNENEEDTENS
jgi:hypothetical protein